jgi:peptidoglycan/LPS O-acetylase OafA/YrhL
MIGEAIRKIFLKPKGIRGLDGFRALCVILVLIDHAGMTSRFETGTLAVWAFFALSGFLIVPILFNARMRVEAGTSDALRELLLFTRDRALRIFPVYYVALLVALVLGLKFGSADNVEKLHGAIGWLFTYTTNISIGFVRESWLGPLSHLWTLAVEQQFYVLFPLLFIFIPSKHWLMALAAAIVVLMVTSLLLFSDSELKFRVNSLSGFYAICIGGLFGLLVRERRMFARVPFPGLILSGLGLLVVLQHLYFTEIGRTDISLLIAPVLSALLITLVTVNQSNAAIRFLEMPLIRGVGVVSYGFYLFHGFLLGPSGRLISLITKLNEGFFYQLLQVLLAFVVTTVVSCISFLYFEQRFMDLKKRHMRNPVTGEAGVKPSQLP